MKNWLYLLSGILAPIIYILAVLIGGALRSDYSHIANFVSDLIQAGAPNKNLLDPIFGIYNLATGAFAIGLFFWIKDRHQPGVRMNTGSLGAIVLLAEAFFGFVTIFFPEPAPGSPVTTTGMMHIILASLSSLTTMATILLVGIWFRKVDGMRSYSTYSFVSLAIVFCAGGLAAYSGATHSAIAGLVERITIGGFLQWMLVIGIVLFQSEKKVVNLQAGKV
jgi:hypothetical protein